VLAPLFISLGTYKSLVSVVTISRSRDIVVDVATSYGLASLRFESRAGEKDFSSLKSSRLALGSSSLLFNGNRDYFFGIKRPEREVNHSSSSSDEVRNVIE
jgi:hypothetical protein